MHSQSRKKKLSAKIRVLGLGMKEARTFAKNSRVSVEKEKARDFIKIVDPPVRREILYSLLSRFKRKLLLRIC